METFIWKQVTTIFHIVCKMQKEVILIQIFRTPLFSLEDVE